MCGVRILSTRGTVYRVSGPLVIAEKMRGSKVYEVVEVGSDRLIGEIIGIEGDKAIIQVYEDTTGLRVGDPVYGTGYPLAAELGPGLIGSIYDGIQRPLPVLQELVGFFVQRGVKAAPLPRDKKWHFIPLMRKGEKVGPGDILGYVEETETVKHYIMVPPDQHGVIEEIVPEGDYTIIEPIARISGKEITMLQKWPVRKPRPYKKKLEPKEPLITGQRVIDFFFPLAKGGKAAIPGGFGTGKCIMPGTPILLADWELLTIDELFKKVKNGEPDPNLSEEIIEVKDKDLYVYSFDGRRFRKARITHVYRGYTDKIVKIKTASGRIIEVTPIHKLPVFDPDGYVRYTKAINIKPGNYLIIPRKIPIKESAELKLDKYIVELAKYKGITSRDQRINSKIREIIRRFNDKQLEELSKTTGLSISTIKTVAYSNRAIPLKLAVTICEKYSIKLPRILGMARSKKSLKIPKVINKELAEFLGLLLSDGSIINRKIVFFNNDDLLRKKFNDLAEKVFGIKGIEKYCNSVKCVEINSSLLALFLKILGIPTRKKSRNAMIPEIILKAPVSITASFIKGYYLGDGGFHKSSIEFYSASKKLITGLAYLLSKLGILYSIGKNGHKIIISGLSELAKFYNIVMGDAPPINKVIKVHRYILTKKPNRLSREAIPLSPHLLKKLYSIISKRTFEKNNIYIGNQIYGNENISKSGLQKILLLVGKTYVPNNLVNVVEVIERLKNITLMFNYVTTDKVESVEVINKKTYVYDVTVEKYHNFIGGMIPVIFHNTVTLQQLTKWSQVDIAIYVGCGERGNEMADALHSFRKLVDPRTGKPLVERSLFIANTSNMPVAARETSIFLGATFGEYFRDMGYHVLMVADSTSRWAEAMREISGRLEELPGEEGYPAYLGSRLASFYERSGHVETLGRPERTGSLTIMGAVSPPGADFSEPVTQATLRIVRALYALDVNLAYRRHYPAINWLISYSLYVDNVTEWWHKEIDPSWRSLRERGLEILQKEAELEELVRLVGAEALPEEDKLVLEVARMIREDFLQQNAFHEIDTYCPPKKAVLMMRAIMMFYDYGLKALRRGITAEEIRQLKCRVLIARMKEIPNTGFEPHFEELFRSIEKDFEELMGGR